MAEKPLRTVRLAAHELQAYVEMISGARLTIATQPTSGVSVQIYVGRSEHTDRLKYHSQMEQLFRVFTQLLAQP